MKFFYVKMTCLLIRNRAVRIFRADDFHDRAARYSFGVKPVFALKYFPKRLT